MSNPKNLSWWPKVVTLLIWLLLGASVAYWWLLSQGRGQTPQVAPSALQAQPEPSPAKVSLALSGSGNPRSPAANASAGKAAVVTVDSRFNLLGVVAHENGSGVALLAVEGRAAKPFRTGSLVLAPYYLHRVQRQSAVLRAKADGNSELEIKLNTALTKTGNAMGLPVPQAALPVLTPPPNFTPPMSPSSVPKVEGLVSGADEARATAVQRAALTQSHANAPKGGDFGANQ